jgi:hypothetical protein
MVCWLPATVQPGIPLTLWYTVYDISILSNIPVSVLELLDPASQTQRLKPLFTVGVHDIPALVEYQIASSRAASNEDDSSTAVDDSNSGWVACTTDSILAMKDDLWDMLIVMPPAHSSNATHRVWPTVECPKGHAVKATQRDLRRYRALKEGLTRLRELSAESPAANHSPRSEASAPGIRLSTSSRPGTLSGIARAAVADEDWDQIVEPSTWAALAYHGFMWWASAGEQRSEEMEELAQDASLLAELAPSTPAMQGSSVNLASGVGGAGMADSVSSLTARRARAADTPGVEDDEEDERARIELAMIAYFHRLTTQMLATLADVVESADDDDMLDVDVGTTDDDDDDSAEETGLLRPGDRSPGTDNDDYRGWVRVDSDALGRMGLDVWSKADVEFVKELTARYFARKAYVESKGVEVCGMRVC